MKEILRIPEIITATDLVRMNRDEIFDRLDGEKEVLVVTGSRPVAVLVSVERWQEIGEALLK